MTALTGRTWTVPDPPLSKQRGIEGDAAWIVELWLSGNRDAARERWRVSREKLIASARKGMPKPGARHGSANWAPSACVAWALSEPANAEPWRLLREAAEWYLAVCLWSTENLSGVYGWLLHEFSVAAAVGETLDLPEAREATRALRRLLAAHRWLLEQLVVRSAGKGTGVIVTHPKLRVAYDPLVHAPGERSPPSRHDGSLLSGWLRSCTLDAATDPEVRKALDGAWSWWPWRLLYGIDNRVLVPESVWPEDDDGIKLRTELTIARIGDDFVAFMDLRNPNTAGTSAVSRVDGRMHVLDLGQRNKRVKRVTTTWVDNRVFAVSSDGLTGSIPAPRREDCAVLVIPAADPREFREGREGPKGEKPARPAKPGRPGKGGKRPGRGGKDKS